ncbi:solute carrier family 23 protein [Dietzia maris]|uniref:uracil-xanthine permease family protein n=1 Tax=Dietzia maris TaxID=37915 RepID=UPI00344D2DF6
MDNVSFKVGFEDRVTPFRAMFYGGQHLLALTGLWVFPATLGAALALQQTDVAKIIQGCFLLAGIVTVLSSSRILKLPIVQGPTAAILVALIAIGAQSGLGTAFGSMMVAGLLSIALAIPFKRLGVYGHISQFVANPIVFGTMFLVLGAQLAGIGVGGWVGTAGTPGYGWPSVIVALSGLVTVFLCMALGGETLIKRGAVVWGIVVGTLVAWTTGVSTVPDVSNTPLFGAPEFLPFGFSVSWAGVVLMMIAFLQAASESMGVYGLLGRWSGTRISVDRANRGLTAEFLGSALGGLFGGIGTTSYPENAGVLRMTGIASRMVTGAAGVLCIVLACIPKFAMFLAGLPGPALSAAATILFGVLAFSGVQQLATVEWDDLNILVGAVCFIIPIGLQFLPSDLVETLPEVVSGVITSPMMVSTILLLTIHPLVNFGIRRLLNARHNKIAATTAPENVGASK